MRFSMSRLLRALRESVRPLQSRFWMERFEQPAIEAQEKATRELPRDQWLARHEERTQLDAPGRAVVEDARAGAGRRANEPLGGERREGGADREAAHAKLNREVSFAREVAVGGELAAQDAASKIVGDACGC